MGACTLTPGNYCARLMNSIIGLGVSMSLAPFVCWERDGIALGWNGEEGGERGMEGEAKRGKGVEGGERGGRGGGGQKNEDIWREKEKGGNRGKEVRGKIKEQKA